MGDGDWASTAMEGTGMLGVQGLPSNIRPSLGLPELHPSRRGVCGEGPFRIKQHPLKG